MLASLLACAGVASAAPRVFKHDPRGPGRVPYTILPGTPLLLPGPDGTWGTADDVVKLGKIGDVDIVVRTGAAASTVPAPGAALPAGSPSLAAAPTVVAGGLQTGIGTQLPYRFLVSDGVTPPAAGHFLASNDLDGRGTLVLAFADLDGDGFIGPTAAGGNDPIKRQEALMLAGRRLALIGGGTASDGLAVSLGLPASVGGLGIVVAGGAATGATPYLYKDGPWIGTLLPCLWPLDPNGIIGGETADPPDPVGLVDLELDVGSMYCPAPANPLFGTPFAIPLDGSSVTNDLARSLSGPPAGVAFARPVDPATFVPSLTRQVLPVIGPQGERRVVEPLASIDVPDDGPGGGVTFLLFPADLLGNAADPPPGGWSVALDVGPGLRIAVPDRDGDPRHETVAFDGPAAVAVTLDDAGAGGPGGAQDQLIASLGGEVLGALRVNVVAPGTLPPPNPLRGASQTQLLFAATPAADGLLVDARFKAAKRTVDPSSQDVTIALAAAGSPFYTRTIPAGALVPDGSGRGFTYADDTGVAVGRIAALSIKRDPARRRLFRLQLDAGLLDYGALDPGTASIEESISIGATRFAGTLACTHDVATSTTTCK